MQETEVKLIMMSEVPSEKVNWLWYPYIPYGKITIVQGDPGDGKTTFILAITALLTTGRLIYPDGQVDCYYLPALFILLSTKNSLFRKTKNYITEDGIDFQTMMEKQDFSSGEAKLIRLAANLFNGSMEVTPYEIINTLDAKNYNLAMQAIYFRRHGCHIENLLNRTMENKAEKKKHFERER